MNLIRKRLDEAQQHIAPDIGALQAQLHELMLLTRETSDTLTRRVRLGGGGSRFDPLAALGGDLVPLGLRPVGRRHRHEGGTQLGREPE